MSIELSNCPTSDDIRAMVDTENIYGYIKFFDREHDFRTYVSSIDDIAGYHNFQTHVRNINTSIFGLSERASDALMRMETFVEVSVGIFLDTAPHGFTKITMIWCPVTRMALCRMS